LTTILKNVRDTVLLGEHDFSEKEKPYGDTLYIPDTGT